MKRARKSPVGLAWSDVLALVADLPGVEVSTSYGTPAIKVKGVLLVRLREDGETIVVRSPFVVRDYLLRTAPRVFFLEEHYRNYPTVLVRLAAVGGPQLRELIEDAWRAAAPKRLVAQYTRRGAG